LGTKLNVFGIGIFLRIDDHEGGSSYIQDHVILGNVTHLVKYCCQCDQ